MIREPLSFGLMYPFSDLTVRLIIKREKIINKTTYKLIRLPMESEVFFSLLTLPLEVERRVNIFFSFSSAFLFFSRNAKA